MLDSSGQAVYADQNDESIGVTMNRATAAAEVVPVSLWSAPGTYPVTASEAIAAINTQLYGADDGKVSDTPGGELLGVCRQTASGNNSQIEMVCRKAGNIETITETMAFGAFTDGGGTSGTYTFTKTLPAGAMVLGWKAIVATGFTGDTTASCQVGVSGNVNQFTQTAPSVLAAATVGAIATGSSDSPILAAATAPLVTVTGTADFTSISAGSMAITIAYLKF
jgi:hypothetical protein